VWWRNSLTTGTSAPFSVEQHKRPQRIPGLPDPADSGNLQYRNIPDPTSNSASHVPMRSNDT